MPISNSYPRGVPIEDADLFVGTKANNNRTVNYTAAGIADYLNINSRIAIGGQMSFQFVISPNVPGTISFEEGGGNNTPFSTITKLIVSAIDVSSSNITIFLNYLTNSDILLSQQNEPNYFGHYKITGYTQIDTTEFYQLDLSYIGGNGNIERDLYYDIVSFVITSGSSTTPSLDEVLTEGSVASIVLTDGSTYDVNLPFDDGFDIYMGDSVTTADNNNQALRTMQYSLITNTINSENSTFQLSNQNLLQQLYPTSGDYNIIHQSTKTDGADAGGVQIQIPTPKTFSPNGQVNYKFPYKEVTGDYTLATLDDIPSTVTLVPYTGATQDVDLGLFDITAASLIKNGGIATQFLKADGSVDNNTYLTSADLPSTLDLFATTSPDPVISGYTALVRNITDSRYNTTAVDVPTPTITGTVLAPTFCGAVISDSGILLGNPGVFNFSVIGKIRRTGGSTSSGADFFYSIYKRDISGVETLIADSAPVVVPANGGVYTEYISIALWNDGIFLSTDRVVLKFYGIKSGTGSGATYEFLFGGTDPVRGTAAISSAIIPNIYLRDIADVEKVPALDNEVLYWNDADSLWEHALLVTDAIVDGVTTVAPSQNAVFNAIENLGLTTAIANPYTLRATTIGSGGFTQNGQPGAGIVTFGNTAAVVAGTIFKRQLRINFSTLATAGSIAFFRTTFGLMSVGANYECEWLFGTADAAEVTGARSFIGFSNSFATPANVEPTSLVNIIGIARLSTSSNWHIVHNDATGLATSIDLGSLFPSNTSEVDLIYLKLILNIDNTVSYSVINVTTNTAATGLISTNLPATGSGLYETIWTTNNATALIARLGFCIRTFTNKKI